MKSVLKSWKLRLRGLFTWNLLPLRWGSGTPDKIYFTGLIVFYSIIAGYHAISMYINHGTDHNFLKLFILFVVFIYLLATPKRYTMDIVIDLFMMGAVAFSIETDNNFSAAALLFILVFRTIKNWQLFVILSVALLAISGNAVIQKLPLPEAFKLIILYVFLLFKFYHMVIKPYLEAIAKTKDLENELYKRGPAKQLTDDQIIQKYPFMYHPRENQYRRIEDVRMLADGLNVKEIAAVAEVEPNTISREFDDLKVNIGVFIDTKIMSKEQLVKVCIELGIIEVSFIHR